MPFWNAAPVQAAEMKPDGNSFTLLRWVLASSVMISHAWDLTQPQRGLDPTVAILDMPISRMAVYLFFTLSGFLVTGSLVKRGTIAFLKARALRLVPGLWVMLLAVPLGLALAVGSLPVTTILTAPETLRFIGRNAALIGGAYTLPGIFADHQFANVVNGSLWTITYEVRCYLGLALLGALGLMLPRPRLTLLLVAGLAAHMAIPADLVPAVSDMRRLAFAFYIGVLAWAWRDRLPLSWVVALAAVALATGLAQAGVHIETLLQTSFGYLALVAAFRLPAPIKRLSNALPDYSYGIYIYAFPMQQLAITLGFVVPLVNLGIGFLMTLPAAALSWHLIEGPALRLKRD